MVPRRCRTGFCAIVRRTSATNLQKLGVRLEVTEAVLNHVSGSRAGIVGVYQRHEWAVEKRAALTAWATRLTEIVSGGELASNVVELAKGEGMTQRKTHGSETATRPRADSGRDRGSDEGVALARPAGRVHAPAATAAA